MTRGENNPRAVLTDDEVERIRSLRDSEADQPRSKRFWTIKRLAEKFEVSTRQIDNILAYKQRTMSAEDGETRTRR